MKRITRKLRCIAFIMVIMMLGTIVGCASKKEDKGSKNTTIQETTAILSSSEESNEKTTVENETEEGTTVADKTEEMTEGNTELDSTETTTEKQTATKDKETTTKKQTSAQKETTTKQQTTTKKETTTKKQEGNKEETTTKIEKPTISNEVVAKGCVYWEYVGEGESIGFNVEYFDKTEFKKYEQGSVMPNTSIGDVYQTAEYYYVYTNGYASYTLNDVGYDLIEEGWNVADTVEDKSKYGEILSYINGKPVLHMNQTFGYNDSIIYAPKIPNTIIGMRETFYASSLEKATDIPGNVKNMESTFARCHNLEVAPKIGYGVEYMLDTFWNCSSLVTAPTIPSSVTYMGGTFTLCKSLVIAPSIPEGVENISCIFLWCDNLTTAPTIPASVKIMNSAFNGCISLTGTIEINAKIDLDDNLQDYKKCFGGVNFDTQNIQLTGSCEILDELKATSDN